MTRVTRMRARSSQLRVFGFSFHNLSVLCALSVAAMAQTGVQGNVPTAQEIPTPGTISTNVHLVLVPVTVTDRKGKFIDGLSAEDFVVGDNGARQKIRMDTSDT